MWMAVAELMSRGAVLSAKDSQGHTPLDKLIRKARHLGPPTMSANKSASPTVSDGSSAITSNKSSAPDKGHSTEPAPLPVDIGSKVQEVRKSRMYSNTKGRRRQHLDEFLDACLAQDSS